jgi:hypothetical protein
MEERRDELGVRERSGMSGAAIAKLERKGLWDHMSGDGVSARKPAGFDEAAERGRGMGLNSVAFAFKRRGEDNGEAGRLAVNWGA